MCSSELYTAELGWGRNIQCAEWQLQQPIFPDIASGSTEIIAPQIIAQVI